MALVDYSSSSKSSESSDIEVEARKIKRIKYMQDQISKTKKLPIPGFMKQSFGKSTNETIVDSPQEHDGKIRSFEHVRGNWASFVYINVNLDFDELQDEIQKSFEENLNLKYSKEIHISLTKTLILRHHWINDFSNSVLEFFNREQRFQISFGSLDVYTNEEKSRTFIGLNIESPSSFILQRLTNSLDKILEEFRLEKFYSKPLFHASILWCVGNHKKYIQSKSEELKRIFNRFALQEDNIKMEVDKIIIKIGNKYYTKNLKR